MKGELIDLLKKHRIRKVRRMPAFNGTSIKFKFKGMPMTIYGGDDGVYKLRNWHKDYMNNGKPTDIYVETSLDEFMDKIDYYMSNYGNLGEGKSTYERMYPTIKGSDL